MQPTKWSALAAIRAVRDDERLTAHGKLVGYTLISRADSRTACWAWSQRRIALDASLGKSSVKVALPQLVEAGTISIRKRTVEGTGEQDTNEYRVDVGWLATEVGRDTAHVGHDTPPGGPGDGQQVGRNTTPGRSPHGQITGLSTGLSQLDEVAPPAPLTLTGEPTLADLTSKKPKAKKAPKYTPEEIAAHNRILDAFISGVKVAKGLDVVKVTHQGDHAAIYALLREYGEAETLRMFATALKDTHVLKSNCTIRYIASKPLSWLGTAPPVAKAQRPGVLVQRDSDWTG